LTKYHEFKEFIESEAKKFEGEHIRIISHLDSDGIAAASILVQLCNLLNKSYSVSILPQLDHDSLIKISKEDNEVFVFSDIGSNQISLINSLMKDKKVFILDHHKPENVKTNAVHINPHLFGIDGSTEISGSGVVYLFARAIHEGIKEFSYIPIIGAIGDVQENKGFKTLNNEILEDALNYKKIRRVKGLNLFGLQTRPLHKLLEYCTDFNLPGITACESGTIQFLQEIGINPKDEGRWKKFYDLTGDEIDRLVRGLILRRKNEENPEAIIGVRYTLVEERHDSPFYDLKEFSTILNSCGRLKKYSYGIGACLGDKKAKKDAIQALSDYKKEIVTFMDWFKKNRGNERVIEGDNYIIIDGKKNVPATMIGTMASIISKSRLVEKNIFVLGLARQEKQTKVSLRISSRNNSVDLRKIISKITTEVGGESGGHQFAAGAIIDFDKEQDFIKKAKEVLQESVIS